MGQPIGSRYELESQLGRGAFGSVWRGTVRDTGEAVAIKVLLEELATDADVVTRFLRERTAMMGLRHRSLVSIRDLVVEGDVLALVLQLVEGPDLRAYLRGRGRLEPVESALLVADVAEALAVAHAAQIIHRDVKPANVLLQPESGGFRPLLTDFGIARLADAPSVTRTSQVVGTPYYLAPEVISGKQPTSAVDVYASGIMLLELILGHPPFRGKDAMEVFEAHQSAAPQRPAGVDDRLWTVVSRALAKDPNARPSAAELAATLRNAVRTQRDGTIAQLPVNKIEGTVVLPALATAMKQAALMSPPPPPLQLPARQEAPNQLAPRPAAAQSPRPGGYPPQPYYPAPAPQPGPQNPRSPQGRPQSPPARDYAQPTVALPQAQHRPPPPPQPARQTPVPPPQPQQQSRPNAQYGSRPQQSPPPPPAAPARRQAPRYPADYGAQPQQRSGLSCLSKLAILLIVLLAATAIGLAIGKELEHKHLGSGSWQRAATVSLESEQPHAAPAW
ncbi:MAG TPA: serine/threonine-protein kinase [Actinocrinis sp.]|nr:serine/threonine-protein kinase [Actinocrinis sp.]